MLVCVSRLLALGMTLVTCPCVSARAIAKQNRRSPCGVGVFSLVLRVLRAPALSLAGQRNARGCGPRSVVRVAVAAMGHARRRPRDQRGARAEAARSAA
jgi:hypothetical protein